jgi:hypothetical protein
MQSNNGEIHQEISAASFPLSQASAPPAASGDVFFLPSERASRAHPTDLQPEGERMSLSLLRRRIRAGWYQDDLRSQQTNHLIFLRWLVREGLLSEWDGVEE